MNKILSILMLWGFAVQGAFATSLVKHDFEITLYPDKGAIAVKDILDLSQLDGLNHSYSFLLHKSLDPQIHSANGQIVKSKEMGGQIFDEYTIELQPDASKIVTLTYAGKIEHPVTDGDSPGHIGAEGVSLLGSTYWYPMFENALATFKMTVHAPEGWVSVSQGEEKLLESGLAKWEESQPQDALYLMSYTFETYQLDQGRYKVQVFLRNADEALAQKYLGITSQYIKMYEDMLGEYPYKKFALIENFWETGYGMPSFTLLGQQVIRLPFILYTSYPHEILHNWWGNSVYIDHTQGNWAEGLTSYLADHYLKIETNGDVGYRRGTLKDYVDYVTEDNDFPVSSFISRYDEASRSVGYGKVMMFFRMLEIKLGKETFFSGLRHFYASNMFREASFGDIRKSMEHVSGESLAWFFDQWLNRTGAVDLEVVYVDNGRSTEGYRVNLYLEQKQKAQALPVKIPVKFTFADGKEVYRDYDMYEKLAIASFLFAEEPVSVHVDPNFDVFRYLNQSEVPSSVSEVIAPAQELVSFVLPSQASSELLDAYEGFAKTLESRFQNKVEILLDKDIVDLPVEGSVWILGTNNKFTSESLASLGSYDLRVNDDQFILGGQSFMVSESLASYTFKNPGNPKQSVNLVLADDVQGLPVLARKIVHYGKYGAIAFDLNGQNFLKYEWERVNSPFAFDLTWQFD